MNLSSANLLEKFFTWQENFLRNAIPHWLHPVFRLKTNFDENYVSLVAAGVAFYFFLAAFPALAALISLYGLFSNPAFIADHIDLMGQIMPPAVVSIFANQAQIIISPEEKILSFSLLISIFLAIYSAAKGVNALIKGLNIVYQCREKRNYFTLNMTAIALTFIILMYAMAALSLIALMPAILQLTYLPERIIDLLLWIRWPLLFFSSIIGLEIVYYFGPCHKTMPWRWSSWGSFTAAVLWLLFSSLFSTFVLNFGRYNEIYGSLGAVVVLLLWFWLSALMILIGAEIDALIRKQKPGET
jgi:membrane protein